MSLKLSVAFPRRLKVPLRERPGVLLEGEEGAGGVEEGVPVGEWIGVPKEQ